MLNKGLCVGALAVALLGTSPATVQAACFGSLSYCFRQTTTVYGGGGIGSSRRSTASWISPSAFESRWLVYEKTAQL